MTEHSWQPELALAEEAARAAGLVLHDLFEQEQTVLAEEGHDIKLQADRDAEAAILAVLKQSGYAAVAEESGEHGLVCGEAPYWVIDPLDGTANFSRGVPQCCVSVALCHKNEPVVGVIFDFLREECFSGIVGAGATLNGKPMRVSSATKPEESVLSTGFPADFYFDDAGTRQMAEQLHRFKKVRMIGSAALALAYVARGRFDAYFEINTRFWDIAAGAALVRAAGGVVDITPSGKGTWSRRVYAAANGSIWL